MLAPVGACDLDKPPAKTRLPSEAFAIMVVTHEVSPTKHKRLVLGIKSTRELVQADTTFQLFLDMFLRETMIQGNVSCTDMMLDLLCTIQKDRHMFAPRLSAVCVQSNLHIRSLFRGCSAFSRLASCKKVRIV